MSTEAPSLPPSLPWAGKATDPGPAASAGCTAQGGTQPPPSAPTCGGSASSSCGSCGQKSAETMVALSGEMSARWRRRLRGVELLGTPCTLELMRFESARSYRRVAARWAGCVGVQRRSVWRLWDLATTNLHQLLCC